MDRAAAKLGFGGGRLSLRPPLRLPSPVCGGSVAPMKDGLEDQTEIIAGLEAKVREQAAVIAELEGRLKEMQATEAARPQYSLGVLEFAERMVVEAGKEAAIAEA